MGNRVDIKKVFEEITKRAEEGVVGDELKNYLEEEFDFSYEHMDILNYIL